MTLKFLYLESKHWSYSFDILTTNWTDTEDEEHTQFSLFAWALPLLVSSKTLPLDTCLSYASSQLGNRYDNHSQIQGNRYQSSCHKREGCKGHICDPSSGQSSYPQGWAFGAAPGVLHVAALVPSAVAVSLPLDTCTEHFLLVRILWCMSLFFSANTLFTYIVLLLNPVRNDHTLHECLLKTKSK